MTSAWARHLWQRGIHGGKLFVSLFPCGKSHVFSCSMKIYFHKVYIFLLNNSHWLDKSTEPLPCHSDNSSPVKPGFDNTELVCHIWLISLIERHRGWEILMTSWIRQQHQWCTKEKTLLWEWERWRIPSFSRDAFSLRLPPAIFYSC